MNFSEIKPRLTDNIILWTVNIVKRLKNFHQVTRDKVLLTTRIFGLEISNNGLLQFIEILKDGIINLVALFLAILRLKKFYRVGPWSRSSAKDNDGHKQKK